jgi:hypothetical protein
MPHTPADPAGHADHDPLAIAAYAAGDATGSELDAAMALVAACPGCAALHHDLRAIAAALPALPAPVRTRDFRLAPEQAAALRPAGWRRILAPLAGPRFSFAGPLGTGLATLGIAGLLVAGAAGMPLGGATAAPEVSDTQRTQRMLMVPAASMPAADPEFLGASIAPVPQAGTVGTAGNDTGNSGTGTGTAGAGGPEVAGVPQPAASGDPKAVSAGDVPATAGVGDVPTAVVAGDDQAAFGTAETLAPTTPVNAPLVVIAGLLLVAGAALGGLRLAARRVT